MKVKFLSSVLIALLSSFLFLSCDHGPIGLYYSLEVESNLNNGTLKDNITVSDMLKMDGSYYLAAGGVYTKLPDKIDWTSVVLPDSYTLCTNFKGAFNKAYATLINATTDNSALFSYDGTTWIEIDDLKTLRSDLIVPVNDGGVNETLFVTVRNTPADGTSPSYSIYFSTDGISFFEVSGLTLSQPIIDGAFIPSTNEFWLINGSNVYSCPKSDPSLLSIKTTGLPAAAGQFGGIMYSSLLSSPFISTRDTDQSYVWAFNGTTWIQSTESADKLTDFSEMVLSDGTSNQNVVVVGSEKGYLELGITSSSAIDAIELLPPGLSSSTGSITTNVNYVNTTLSTTVVHSFFTDSIDGVIRLYACTSGEGLWINLPAADLSYRIWGRE